MSRCVCVLVAGKSGSGAEELIDYLENIGLERVVVYTTGRPDDGYEYLSKEEFMDRVEDGEICEFIERDGELYGTCLKDYLGGKKCALVNISNVERLCKLLVGSGCSVLLVVMDGNDGFIIKRLNERYCYNEARRRFYLDKAVFDERKEEVISSVMGMGVDVLYVYMTEDNFEDVLIYLSESLFWFAEFLSRLGGKNGGD